MGAAELAAYLPLRSGHRVHADTAHDRCAAVRCSRCPYVRGGGVELRMPGPPFTNTLQRELHKGTPAFSS